MTTLRTSIPNRAEEREKISRGEFSYVCTRNQLHAHDLLLRAFRESGLTQKQLAERAGIDEATLSRLMRRPQNVEINTLSKLIYAALGASIRLNAELPQNRADIVVIDTSYAVRVTNKFLEARTTPLLRSNTSYIKQIQPTQSKSTSDLVYA